MTSDSKRPSFAPVLMALGLMCVLWGAVTTGLLSAAGLIVVILAVFRWIQDARAIPSAALTEHEDAAEPMYHAPVQAEFSIDADSRRAGPWLHRYAVVVAVFTFALVIVGALSLRQIHVVLGAAVGLLTVGLALWLAKTDGRPWLRNLGWAAAAAVVVQALLGGRSPAVSAIHALLAQLFFALTAALVLCTSASWAQPAEKVEAQSRLSLRSLSTWACGLMILQVALGAAVRHKMMNATVHIVGAMIVTIVLLVLSILVTNQFPEHRGLRPPAKNLIGVTFTQVMLGMAAFITRLMADEASLAVVIPSAVHVANGALTLATTVLLTLQIRRYVA